jgi:hypothetical protein
MGSSLKHVDAARQAGRGAPISRTVHARPVLLAAFAVMADPVSSVAYAIEAALRALGGDLGLLAAAMGLAVGIRRGCGRGRQGLVRSWA